MGFTLLLLGSSLGLAWPLASEYTRSFAVVLSRDDLPAQLSFWAQPSWSHLCHLQALSVATHWALSSMKLGNSGSGLLLMPGLSPSCYQYLAHYRKVLNLGIPHHVEVTSRSRKLRSFVGHLGSGPHRCRDTQHAKLDCQGKLT